MTSRTIALALLGSGIVAAGSALAATQLAPSSTPVTASEVVTFDPYAPLVPMATATVGNVTDLTVTLDPVKRPPVRNPFRPPVRSPFLPRPAVDGTD